MTSGSVQNMSWVPLPWCASQSTIEDLRAPVAQRRGGDRDVVEQAEAHRVRRATAWWPGGRTAQNAAVPSPAARARRPRPGPTPAASSAASHDAGRRGRVGVERAAAARAERLELVEVRGGVHPLELGPRRPPGRQLARPPRRVRRPRSPASTACEPGRALGVPAAGIVLGQARIGRHQEHRRRVPSPVARAVRVTTLSVLMKAQSFRYRGGVVRIAAWHGRADVASLARPRPGAARVRVRRAAARSGPRGRLPGSGHERARARGDPAARRRRVRGARPAARARRTTSPTCPRRRGRTRRARRSERDAMLAADQAAFDEFWHLDADGLREAARATPSSHLRVDREAGPDSATRCSGGPTVDGYVQRLAVRPEAQGRGLGARARHRRAELAARRGAARAYVNTQSDNDRAYDALRTRRVPAAAGRAVRARANAVNALGRVPRGASLLRARVLARAACRGSSFRRVRRRAGARGRAPVRAARPGPAVGRARRRRAAAARHPGGVAARPDETCTLRLRIHRRSRPRARLRPHGRRRAARQPDRPTLRGAGRARSSATRRVRSTSRSGSSGSTRSPTFDIRAPGVYPLEVALRTDETLARSSPGSSSPIRRADGPDPVRLASVWNVTSAAGARRSRRSRSRGRRPSSQPGGRLDDIATLLDDAGPMPLTARRSDPETLESWDALAQTDPRLGPGLARVENAVRRADHAAPPGAVRADRPHVARGGRARRRAPEPAAHRRRRCSNSSRRRRAELAHGVRRSRRRGRARRACAISSSIGSSVRGAVGRERRRRPTR